MSAAGAQEIGKGDLARALGWSRPRMDRKLNSDPTFPVISRGDQGGGWKFSEYDAKAYLRERGEWEGPLPGEKATTTAPKRPKTAAIDLTQLRDAVAPPPPPAVPKTRNSSDRPSEATARARKEMADALLKENKLREQNGELVVRSEMRQAVTDILVIVGSGLDALPDQIARKMQLEQSVSVIRDLVDKIRIEMVTQARKKLLDD